MSDFIGQYKNTVGAEIEVTGIYYGGKIIGTVYTAVQHDELLGSQQLLITPAGLVECGYAKIEEK